MTLTDEGHDIVYDLLIHKDIQLACQRSGLYKWDGNAWQPTYESLGLDNDLATVAIARDGQSLFAGVEGGIMVSHDLGDNWQAFQLPVPHTPVSDLLVVTAQHSDHAVIAATAEDGIYRTEDHGDTWGDTWQSWNGGLFDRKVLCLNSTVDGTVLAGTTSGLYRSSNSGRSWQAVDLPCDPCTILSLYAEPQGQLVAGAEAHGLYVSRDSGMSWQPPGQAPLPEGPVNTVIAADHRLVALIGDRLWITDDPDRLWKPALEGSNITAIAAPDGLSDGARLVIGCVDGSIHEHRLLD